VIGLRLTHGATSQVLRLDRDRIVLGASPTADVTLQHAGWPDEALVLEAGEGRLVATRPDGTRQDLVVGQTLPVGRVEVEILAIEPARARGPGMFGDYDDMRPLAGGLFELEAPAPPASHSPPAPAQVLAAPAGAGGSASRRPPPPRAGSEPRERKATEPSRARQPQPAPKQATPATGSAATRRGAAGAVPPHAVFPEEDFGTALREHLRRAPHVAISAAIHTVIFVLGLLLEVTPEPSPPPGPPAMSALVDAGEVVGEQESAEEDLEEPELPAIDESMPELPSEESAPRSDATEAGQQPTWAEQLPDDFVTESRPMEIGIMPSVSAASRRVRPAKPPVPKADLARAFRGDAGAVEGNKEAARIVRDGLLRGGRRGSGSKITDLGPQDILVVRGSFDHIERVLELLALPYVTRDPWTLAAEKIEDFKKHKVVFWNCSEQVLPSKRMELLARSLRNFVAEGGYLFTTDWGIATVLEPAFPGYLSTGGREGMRLPDMVVDIRPVSGMEDHPLLDGVFHPGIQGRWWLEQASFDVRVGKRDEVDVLIESPALQDVYQRSPVVAATFHYRRGRVLHAMGHYFQEAGNVAGSVTAQRLALNFVLMRLDQDKK
jgi:hypothetical protein